MDELTIGDKVYISSKKAASITGYAKDYVGQLCREGRVEATLVGRSWYVLEESIREHRFDKEKEKSSPIEPEIDQKDWDAAVYKTEKPDLLPELSKSVEANAKADAAGEVESVANMQSVWREWFERRTIEEKVSTEPVEEARTGEFLDKRVTEEAREEIQELGEPNEQEYQVPIHRNRSQEINTGPYVQDIIPLQRNSTKTSPRDEDTTYTIAQEESVPQPSESVTKERKGSSSLILKALIVGLTILIVSVSVVSSGLAESLYDNKSPLSGLFNYLGGTRTISK